MKCISGSLGELRRKRGGYERKVGITMKGMRTSSQKRRAPAARKTLAALLLSAIMCFYGVPVAAIGESAANASNAGTLEQAGESIQDSLTLDANGADAAAKTLKAPAGRRSRCPTTR